MQSQVLSQTQPLCNQRSGWQLVGKELHGWRFIADSRSSGLEKRNLQHFFLYLFIYCTVFRQKYPQTLPHFSRIYHDLSWTTGGLLVYHPGGSENANVRQVSKSVLSEHRFCVCNGRLLHSSFKKSVTIRDDQITSNYFYKNFLDLILQGGWGFFLIYFARLSGIQSPV